MIKRIILTFLTFLFCFANDQIFIEPMEHGKYMIAIPVHLTNDRKDLHRRLNQYVHLPEYKQQDHKKKENHKIDYDYYPQNFEQLDIGKSIDKQALTKIKDFCIEESLLQMTPTQKLQKFKKGKCSPVIIVPGILATSLMVQIDCVTLQQRSPQILKNCGWGSCGSISAPADQYLLWVGLDLMLKVNFNSPKCFGDLFGLIYNNKDNSTNFGLRYSFPEGVKSTWFGNTQSSKGHSKCGANAIRDIGGYVSTLSMLGGQCALKDYGRLVDTLTAMGYDSGVTMQPLPYDFRYGILAGETQKLIPQIINNLYKMTGKKVVVVAHSLGTLHTLSGLAFFVSKKMKDQMVRHYIPITPPWFGTVSAIRNMIYGDSGYFDGGMGINRYAQMKFTQISGSTFDLFLRDAFEKQRDEPWMKEVLKRIQYENKPKQRHQLKDSGHEAEEIPLSWFPSKDQICFDPFFKEDPSCQMGLIDFKNKPIFKIEDKNYYGTESSMKQLFKDSLTEQQYQVTMQLWQQTKQKNKSLHSLPAPEVNTSMIFTTLYKTQIYYEFDRYAKDAASSLNENNFVIPKTIVNCPGDISVPSFSPLLFIAKWIHNKANGNHSINVIQYCANYKGNNNKIYSTIACECNKNPFKNQLDCTHPCIISDRYIISFVLGILTNSQKGYDDDRGAISKAMNFTDMQIKQRIYDCINLKTGNYLGNCAEESHQLEEGSVGNEVEGSIN